MGKKIGAFLVCTLLALGATVAVADTVEVRLFDPQGQLVTDGNLLVLNEAGQIVKSLPRPDGVFEINALVGEKLEMFFSSASIGAKPFKFSEVVPATTLINASMADGTPSNDEACDAEAVAVPSVTAGSTSSATFDGAPTCVTSNTAPGVWYTVTGTGNEMTASTCPDNGGSSTYDSKISVFCLDCETPTCVTGNDDSCSSSFLLSTATWCS